MMAGAVDAAEKSQTGQRTILLVVSEAEGPSSHSDRALAIDKIAP